MAVFRIKTKNQTDIDKKPRVYFTCHPDDFDKYFDTICNDIFKTHDCAIYYTEDMTAVIEEEGKELDLGRNNLFVVPVTYRLLSDKNRAMDEDIPYAIKEHIPVLPIMMESGYDTLYSRADKFGELQYLNPHSTDISEIAYEEKLKKYLESVLISDELANRIRAAFDAYIFLSYRKKDRKYANELMKLIHKNPEYTDIAIWFDEFLTPGESFKENISKILKDSKLFALLITPNLLEMPDGKPNFVMSEEYPAAKEYGIGILPAEMESTDTHALKESFQNLPECVNPHDEESFRERLLDALAGISHKENDTPSHNFLIGLAYMDGIDVEVNRRLGIRLITSAAEAGLFEAMEQLCNIYLYGTGTNVDYQKVVYWLERVIDKSKEEYGKEDPKTLAYMNNLAVCCGYMGEYKKSLDLHKRVYKLSRRVSGSKHNDTIKILCNMAAACQHLGYSKKALRLFEKVYRIRCKSSGEEHPESLIALNNLVTALFKIGDYKKALELQEKVYKASCRASGEEHYATLTYLNNLSCLLSKMGELKKSLETAEKVYEARCRILGEEHPETLHTLGNIASSLSSLGNYKKAHELHKRVYEARCRISGEAHPETIIALNSYAYTCGECGDAKKALSLHEKAYEHASFVLGKEHSDTLLILDAVATSHALLGDFEKALGLHEKVYKINRRILGKEHPNTLKTLNYIALMHSKLKNHKKSLELFEKIYNISCQTLGKKHPRTLLLLHNIASTHLHLGNYKKALELQQRVYKSLKKALDDTHPTFMQCLNTLAYCYAKTNDFKSALTLYKKLYPIQLAVYGEEHQKTKKTSKRIEGLRTKL